ncbi:Uma2 family endonuclease [Actinosynnema sp. NPDC059797]
MDAEQTRPGFDPLVEFEGVWTTELAKQYLPIPGAPPTKYECVDGHLIMSPRENTRNVWATGVLYRHFFDPAREAGYLTYLPVNLEFDFRNWIEPDLLVLRPPVKGLNFVPVELLVLPVELVSPSSRDRDYAEKPARCARAGVPYFMQVEIDGDDMLVNLLQLHGDRYVHAVEPGRAGRKFEAELPFRMSFDPADLLEPGD